MNTIILKDTVVTGSLFDKLGDLPGTGAAKLDLHVGDGWVASWEDHITRVVSYRDSDVPRSNPRITYTLSLSQINQMIHMAYTYGAQDKQKETSKQLQSIFGIKPER